MRSEIAALHKRLGNTMVYVTHDQIEAMTLADRIVVLRDGYVEQVGTPRELYSHPANVFVAQFIGSPKMNILPAASASREARRANGEVHGVGMRPEHLEVVAPGKGLLRGKVRISEYTGAATLLHVELSTGETCIAIHGGQAPDAGADIGLSIAPENLHFFATNGRAIARTHAAKLALGQ
jgi:ABC-type sugar transport system ATPase subunit